MPDPKVISGKTKDLDSEYKWGFVTDIEADVAPKGLNEDIIRLISAVAEQAGSSANSTPLCVGVE